MTTRLITDDELIMSENIHWVNDQHGARAHSTEPIIYLSFINNYLQVIRSHPDAVWAADSCGSMEPRIR